MNDGSAGEYLGAGKPTQTPMKYLMTAAALCIGMFTANAQDEAAQPATMAPAHPAHNCMTATDKEWTSLKLTPDQTTKVKDIQATCMKECGAMMKTDPKMAQMMDKHEVEVKAVLTADQYDNWMKWCSSQANAPEEKVKEKK
jgi:Spy/CpxP family protein refolding chaperone